MLDIAEWHRQVGKKWQSTFCFTFPPSSLHGNNSLVPDSMHSAFSGVADTSPRVGGTVRGGEGDSGGTHSVY